MWLFSFVKTLFNDTSTLDSHFKDVQHLKNAFADLKNDFLTLQDSMDKVYTQVYRQNARVYKQQSIEQEKEPQPVDPYTSAAAAFERWKTKRG